MSLSEKPLRVGTYHNPRESMLWMKSKDRVHLETAPFDLDCGWRVITVVPEQFESIRHGTVNVTGHPDSQYRYVFAFNLEKISDTPELDGKKVSAAIVEQYNQVLDEMMESTPMHGEHNYERPRCSAIYYWDEGLPGELLSLREACFAVS